MNPPADLTLADGTTVPHQLGVAVFNYYDMTPCVITRLADHPEPDTSGQLPDGLAWWVGTDSGTLDGSRLCSLATARRRGWMA